VLVTEERRNAPQLSGYKCGCSTVLETIPVKKRIKICADKASRADYVK